MSRRSSWWRRATRAGDFAFISSFGEFWVYTALLSLVMLAIGACGGVLVSARLLFRACFP